MAHRGPKAKTHVRSGDELLAAAWMREIAYELQRTLEQDRRAAAILDG